jgi:hypothetical protein
MAIVGRGLRGSWLRAAATGSREIGEEEVDEEDRSVAVPEEGTELECWRSRMMKDRL